MDYFPPWLARVRNDPLGPQGYGRVAIERPRWLHAALKEEHIVAVDSVGTAGEHNAPEIPREVGSVAYTGPGYTLHDFRYANSATKTGTGTLTLDLDSAPYSDIYSMAVQIQNCSESGTSKPCLTSYVIVSTSSIGLYSQKMTGSNVWAAEDADFCIAVHGSPVGSTRLEYPGAKQRGDFLTDDALIDINIAIQSDADLRAAFLAEHTAAGLHTNREVAQAWVSAGVRSGGGAYDVLDTGTRNPCAGLSRLGAGICRATFTTAWVLDAQPFVTADFMRLNGGSEGNVFCTVTPRSLISTTTVDIYLWKYTAGSPGTWALTDTDFFMAVHAGY